MNATLMLDTTPELRFYFGVFLTVLSSAGVALNVAAIVLLSLHKTLLPKNQRITVVNVAICDLIFALLGIAVQGPGYMSTSYKSAVSDSVSLCNLSAIFINFFGSVNNAALFPVTFDRWLVLSYPVRYRLLMTTRRAKAIILGSWCPSIIFLLVEVVALVTDTKVYTSVSDVRGRCVIRGLLYLDPIRLAVCNALVTIAVISFYICMWYRICSSTNVQSPTSKRKVAINHTKFATISGMIIFTGALSWVPKSVLRFTGLYLTHHTAYFASVGLQYLVTVTNPIVYIFGTQKNVAHALFKTPIEYRRRMSLSKCNMNSIGSIGSGMHKKCMVESLTLKGTRKLSLLGNTKPVTRQRRYGVVVPPRVILHFGSLMELNLISESECEQ